MRRVYEVTIRPLGVADLGLWADLAHSLWPEISRDVHMMEIERMMGPHPGGRRGWVAEHRGEPVGYAEMGVRHYSDACETSPVAYLEGIWVEPAARRKGVAKELVDHLAAVAKGEGFSEMGSDAQINNASSHAAHEAWGFSEAERIVCYGMRLT